MGFFDAIGDMLGLNKGKATINAATQNQDLIADYGTKAGGILETGLSKAGGYLDKATALTDLGPNANSVYKSAIGLGNPNVAAKAFHASPGYQYALDQGQDAIMRSASARGELQGGGTSIDLLRHGVGLADQDFDQWLARLTGGIDRSRSALGDRAGFEEGATDRRLDLASGVTNSSLQNNLQLAAGKEAGQGNLLDMIGTIVGIGSEAMSFGKPKIPGGGGPKFGYGG